MATKNETPKLTKKERALLVMDDEQLMNDAQYKVHEDIEEVRMILYSLVNDFIPTTRGVQKWKQLASLLYDLEVLGMMAQEDFKPEDEE